MSEIDEVQATIHERGNGLAGVGEYVVGDDGNVYLVIELIGLRQTGRAPGVGDWQLARVVLADWSDIPDDKEPSCSATLEDES